LGKVTDISKLSIQERAKLFNDFGKELSVLRLLSNCPRIVRMFGYCELVKEHKLVLLMERADGGTVADLLDDSSVQLTDLQKAIIIMEAAMGMKYLIGQGVLHRDLKSANLLVDKDGHIMVSDFGISKANHTNTANTAERTRKKTARNAAGTTPWMAPEVLRSNLHTEKSDVWAFAIVMGEILTRNTAPYPGMSHQNIITAVLVDHNLPRIPGGCCPGAPELLQLLHQCREYEPDLVRMLHRRCVACCVIMYPNFSLRPTPPSAPTIRGYLRTAGCS
jgi:serine/threonine protein kinase